MCLHKTHWFPKIAKKDIVVYKIAKKLGDKYVTPYQTHRFEIGYTIKSKVHSLFGIFVPTITSEGVHAYTEKTMTNIIIISGICETFKCIIPKGSLYYIGTNNEVASSKLKVIEKL